jgi:ATP-dependent DNA helicase RecG
MKMIQPQFELLPEAGEDEETRLLEVGRITPVYESLGGAQLASRWQRKVIFRLLEVRSRRCAGVPAAGHAGAAGAAGRETALPRRIFRRRARAGGADGGADPGAAAADL